jgi:hypothetical protein
MIRIMLAAVFLLVVGVAADGCKSGEREAFESKCDASLRLRVEGLVHSAPDSLLDVLGRASGAIDDARRGKLEHAGARLGSVTEDMFTARIPVKQIGAVAVLDFVTSLTLSQTREPLGP